MFHSETDRSDRPYTGPQFNEELGLYLDDPHPEFSWVLCDECGDEVDPDTIIKWDGNTSSLICGICIEKREERLRTANCTLDEIDEILGLYNE